MDVGDLERNTKSAAAATAAVDHRHGRLPAVPLLFGATIVLCFLFYHYSSNPIETLLTFSPSTTSLTAAPGNHNTPVKEESKLEKVLKNAMDHNKTVIITTLNEAWAAPGAVFDVFLESFRIGNQTEKLVDHLVVVALDQKAYLRCLDLHPHCYAFVAENKTDISGDAYFMTPNYLDMMWRRIEFLHSVLELGYNFVFTDVDIVWFRNPFPRFYPDAEFQIACDYYGGNPIDMDNWPNGGFNYVKSSNSTIEFYKFWYESRITYPGLHDQDVFNQIKRDPKLTEIGVTFKFLDTNFFGGFCQPSRDFNSVCTMHANCCLGLDSKVNDLKILLEDWRKYLKLPSEPRSWSIPQKCSAVYHPPVTPDENVKEGGGKN